MGNFLPDKPCLIKPLRFYSSFCLSALPLALKCLSSALKSHSLAQLLSKGWIYQEKVDSQLHGAAEVVTTLHGHYLS